MGESDLDQLIAPVYVKYSNPATTILAAAGDIQIHLRARSASSEEAERLLAEVGPPIEGTAWRSHLLPQWRAIPWKRLSAACSAARGATLSVAESCTPGDCGGTHHFHRRQLRLFRRRFRRVYSDRMKTELLGVDPELIAPHRRERRGRARDGGGSALADPVDLRRFRDGGSRKPYSATGAPPGHCFCRVCGPRRRQRPSVIISPATGTGFRALRGSNTRAGFSSAALAVIPALTGWGYTARYSPGP